MLATSNNNKNKGNIDISISKQHWKKIQTYFELSTTTKFRIDTLHGIDRYN